MNGTVLPQPLKQGVVRLMVMDNTYGCVRHVKDLQGASLGSKASAALSSPAEPKQIQVRPCSGPSATLPAYTALAHETQCSKDPLVFKWPLQNQVHLSCHELSVQLVAQQQGDSMALVLGHHSNALLIPVEVGSGSPACNARKSVILPKLLVEATHGWRSWSTAVLC